MISQYMRPKTLTEALGVLSRPGIDAVPLGGGTVLSRNKASAVVVVDLQDLGLDQIHEEGQFLKIGATSKLEELRHKPIQQALKTAIYREANQNIRQMASIAGSIIAADGRSTLAASLLALDTQLTWQPGDIEVGIGDWFSLRKKPENGLLITSLRIPLNAALVIETVSRTPLDLPLLLIARSKWPSGRTRIAVGGFGNSPILVLDGPEGSGAKVAVRNALMGADDEWASAEYRISAAEEILDRLEA